jgi:DNA-directed RNA polymerase subunit beta'
LRKVLDELFDTYGREETVRVADDLKDIGFKYATASATTINVFDLTIPAAKPEILHAADERVAKISKLRYKGFLSDSEKHRLVIGQWMEANQEIAKLVKLEYHPGESLYRMVDSGARGTWGQMTQLAGMKGLVVSPSGEIIELPVKSSLLEGFRPIEYFISAHSARKGKADTALRTAESGYLTRRLVDASQEVVVREHDCGTNNFIMISQDEADMRQETFSELIFGRILMEDLIDSRGTCIALAGTMIDKTLLKLIGTEKIDMIKARSPLTCRTTSGVCQQCFGMDLSTRLLVDIGIPIGVISSQSIGEPGTQLTMRTFHQTNNSMAEGDITHGIRRVEELFEVRNPKKPAIIAPFDGIISIEEGAKKTDVDIISEPQPKTYILKDGYTLSVKVGERLGKGATYAEKGRSKLMVKEEGIVQEIYNDYIVVGTIIRAKRKLAVGTLLKVKHGAEVFKGQLLSTGQIDIREYMAVVSDIEAQRYIVKEIKKVYTSQGQNVNDKYMEIIIKQLFSKVIIEDSGQSSFVPGSLIKFEEYVKVNEELKLAGKILAKGTRLALGLTNIAKETDSWLSAASFQETIRVMVEASIKGSVDRLDDLKANVIIGRLLPVGNEFKKRYF